MNPLTTARARSLDAVLNIGAPLLAIAAISVQHQVQVGAANSVWAAMLAGALVPVFARFVGKPFLGVCDVRYPGATAYIFLAVCNAGIGAVCALAMLPPLAP